MKPLYKPRDGICSRGWLFMGEQGGPCDKKCQMCYYAHQKNLVFYSLETMIQRANLFRHYYGLKAADISGGEPTIYKHIVPLVQHCSNIGLRPTIITHGQNNHDEWRLGGDSPLYKEIEAAGLEDWLVSLHGGSGKSHNAVLCEDGAFDRLVSCLENVSRPVRFNTTLQKDNYRDLPVNVLKDRPPTVWNAITFNPFFYWADKVKKEIDFQEQYSVMAPHLAKAIQELESVGWECNVRYWPLCIAEEHGFAENVCNVYQVPYDPWEWRLNVTGKTTLDQIQSEGGWEKSENKRASEWMSARDNDKCATCCAVDICDKPPKQYQDKYGLDELTIMVGDKFTHPLHFQKRRAHAGMG